MNTKESSMMTPRSFLVIVCAALVYTTGQSSGAPTELSSNINASPEIGNEPRATIVLATVVPPYTDAKPRAPQKPSRSKHITKSGSYKKPSTKDKGGWAKISQEKQNYSPTLATTGFDEGNGPPSTVSSYIVDNINEPKDYTNKTRTNSSTQLHSIHYAATKIMHDVDDKAGKDIDFGTTQETYARGASSSTEGYHAKAGVAKTATMQTSLVENPNFNAEPILKMSEIKSIFYPPLTTPSNGKSLPMNASVSSSLSLSFAQDTTTLPPPISTTTILSKLDVGHDGVKITKKKQLFDKHFISSTGPSASHSGSLHSPISKDNGQWPALSKNKPTKGGSKKLIEVPNGYLGPIMMKEKTFSVTHHGKKPKPSIVEQQLKDKKLVEIIAPTALMEPTVKVKGSSMQPPLPEFVSIDSASVVTSTAPSITTEGESTVTPVSTPSTAKVEVSAETATTYFLVVAQDNNKDAMEPISEAEIDTTLKEIYTEVINVMDGVSKKIVLNYETAPTMSPKIADMHSHTDTDYMTSSISNPIIYGTERSTNREDLTTQKEWSVSKPTISGPERFTNREDLTTQKEYIEDVRYMSKDMSNAPLHHTDHSSSKLSNSMQVADVFDPSLSMESGLTTNKNTQNESNINDLQPSHYNLTDMPSDNSVTNHPPSGDSFANYSVTEINRAVSESDRSSNHQKIDSPLLNKQHNVESSETSTAADLILPDRITELFSTRTDFSIPDQEIFHSTDEVSSSTMPPTMFASSRSTKSNSAFLTKFPIVDQNILTNTDGVSTIGSTVSPIINLRSKSQSSTKIVMISDISAKIIPTVTERAATIDPTTAYDKSIESGTTSSQIRDENLMSIVDNISTVTYRSSINSHDTSSSSSAIVDLQPYLPGYLPLPVLNSELQMITDSPQIVNRDHTMPPNDLSTNKPSLMINQDSHPDSVTTSQPVIFDGSPSIVNYNYTMPPYDLSTIAPSPIISHDSSAGTSSTANSIIDHGSSTNSPITSRGPVFSTITTDTLVIHKQNRKPTYNSEQTESKISDIQIEVYDSTVEPILASTNFRHNADNYYPSSHVTTKQAPNNNIPQERFTQYVVDKATDFATQDSNAVARASGKPEPAAIEIHINVSEGFGNESEDLEFSYRQSDYRKVTSKKPASSNFITLKPFDVATQNETSNEAAEEIVVEIIDGSPNSTENSASRENLNVNPIFTFRSDDDAQVEIKNVKYYPEDRPKERLKSTDDFFVPHLGQQPPGVNKPMMDRDSDTIFYISNTEVKVGESLPTTNTYDAQMKKSRLESQFFPANYEEHKKITPQRYEEDIILSPVKNQVSDPLKVVRGPLDISYVGESVMEVEQVTLTTTTSPPTATPDVIIQPAVLPEMAIGVPVIGELPPQIELKEIDFMPNFDGNKEESSIQYGGDLIDEGGAMGAGFDMDSYPLGNLGLGQKTNDAISSQIVLNQRVNHFKKDELSADLAASSETTDGNDLIRRSNDSVNGTVIGEKMGNATAYSVMDEPPSGDGELHFTDLHTLFTACFATLLPLVFSVVMAFGLRHLYRKYQSNPFNVMGRNSSTDPLDAEKGNGGDGDIDGVETPDELRVSSLAFGATTDSPSLVICTNSNEVKGKVSDGDGRDCNGSVANGCRVPATAASRSSSSSSDIDVDCIQTIIPDAVLEENAAFIVNCNIETQRPITPAASPPPQPTIATNAAVAGALAATTPSSPSTAGTMQCNYSGANGSITTMTLKNNHLIVETEERNDISRDARETKMHYNNGDKDGVFVVEVSRGADSKIMPGSPVDGSPNKRPFNTDAAVNIVQNDDDKQLSSHEEVQVHPPPPENLNNEIESNHLHQIDEVDEFEEGPRFGKHSNIGLSQSDLSSTSSVDSNKRYSYGNQELYTIEQQDYNTPSPAATKAPHPHTAAQQPQPENHHDDNGHSENGHCSENDQATPNRDPIHPANSNSDVNGHSAVETKPKITAALLKQDTVIINEMTNGLSHNGDDEATPHNSMEHLSNGVAPTIKTCILAHDDYAGVDTENGFDSIISLPDPPSTEEMKQMNDIILMETNQLDSLPPPPPPGVVVATDSEENGHLQHNGNACATAPPLDSQENGDSHSIISSSTPPMNTPTKLMKAAPPPTITVASAPTDISHTNGNCMTGHATTASATPVVEVSAGSS